MLFHKFLRYQYLQSTWGWCWEHQCWSFSHQQSEFFSHMATLESWEALSRLNVDSTFDLTFDRGLSQNHWRLTLNLHYLPHWSQLGQYTGTFSNSFSRAHPFEEFWNSLVGSKQPVRLGSLSNSWFGWGDPKKTLESGFSFICWHLGRTQSNGPG